MFEKSLLWNEAALLRAFLAWNDAFEILMCQSYLHLMYPEAIKKVARIYDPHNSLPLFALVAEGGIESARAANGMAPYLCGQTRRRVRCER